MCSVYIGFVWIVCLFGVILGVDGDMGGFFLVYSNNFWVNIRVIMRNFWGVGFIVI